MSEKGLNSWLATDTVVSFNPYDYCLAGKQHRASFSRKSTKRKEKLDLLHSNVCDPINVESLGAKMYFVIFIDNSTQKTWVFILKGKS